MIVVVVVVVLVVGSVHLFNSFVFILVFLCVERVKSREKMTHVMLRC